MDQLIKLLTLHSLKGQRTQLTALVGIALFGLVQLGVLHADDIKRVQEFLLLLGTYFFADKFSGGGAK